MTKIVGFSIFPAHFVCGTHHHGDGIQISVLVQFLVPVCRYTVPVLQSLIIIHDLCVCNLRLAVINPTDLDNEGSLLLGATVGLITSALDCGCLPYTAQLQDRNLAS